MRSMATLGKLQATDVGSCGGARHPRHARTPHQTRRPAGSGFAIAAALAAAVACAPVAAGAGLAAPPAGEGARGATGAPAGGAALDFSGYQKLLDDYLQVTSKPGEPLETRFDYVRLRLSPGRAERLSGIRQALLSVTPSKLTVRERHAWAINTYNFLVIQLVVDNFVQQTTSKELRAKGIYGLPYQTVQAIHIEDTPFFEFPFIELKGKTWNLNAFERQFVFDGYPVQAPGTKPAPRPRALDPRMHFAVVCAAIGCPPLQPHAFVPESLDVQLDRACRDALASRRHVRWDPALERLGASSVFAWYESDFGGPGQAYEFIKRYAPDSLRVALDSKPKPVIDTFIPWDWNMNWVPHLKSSPPNVSRNP